MKKQEVPEKVKHKEKEIRHVAFPERLYNLKDIKIEDVKYINTSCALPHNPKETD